MSTTEVIARGNLFADLNDDWDSASRYLAIFIDEAEHTIDELITALLALESGGGHESIEQLFVAAHRMKGSAASIGLNRVAKLSHLMEDVLQSLVDGGRPVTAEIADAMLACTDGLRQYVDAMKHGQPENDDFEALARQIIAARNTLDQSNQGETVARETPPAPPSAERSTAPMSAGDLHAHIASLSREEEIDTVLVGQVLFEPDLPQVGLKARLLFDKLSNLGEVRYFDPPPDDVETRERIDLLSFGVATEKSADDVRRLLRIAGIRHLALDRLRTKASSTTASTQGRQKSADAAPASAIKPNETLRVDIDRLDQLMNLAGQLAISKARFTQIADKMNKLVAGGASARILGNVAAELEKMADIEGSSGGTFRADFEHVRNTARHLHGELESVRRDVESMSQVRSCVNDLFESVHLLDRVSDGIHQGVMNTRMLPIGPLFARFHRVIRDITRANGKDIRLAISGEKTELDKRMIDELSDPMIHMIRNSADHGIELPEDRISAGKPAQGTISLDACHRGSNILIRVSDDGQGLDPERIRAKAVEKGLVAAADAERMSRQQIFQLIWMPGLSTADKLTEVSGRGVGMDIVRSKIDELNGTVDIESEPGQGTTLTIKLPLTLAILPSLLVELAGDVFAFPLESVVEIVHVRQGQMNTVQGHRTAIVRDRVVSVLTLGEIFNWRQGRIDADAADGITLVIIGEGDRQLGLAVDRVVGEEDVVIKSIADNYRNVAGVAGASILGDGRVSLILDPPTLMEMSSQPTAAMANV